MTFSHESLQIGALRVSSPDAMAGCLHEIIEVFKEYDERLNRLEGALQKRREIEWNSFRK